MNGDNEQQQCNSVTGACECAADGVWSGPTCSLHKSIPEAGVFVNEIRFAASNNESNHIEIAGPAGTNLKDYRLYFYHGTTDVDVKRHAVDFMERVRKQ